MSMAQIGGINMLFGSGITSMSQLAGIAPGIVPGLASIVGSATSITGLNSTASGFGVALNVLNTLDILLSFMLNSLKKKATSKATVQTPPPDPEPSTTTDSVAVTTPAPSTKPPTPEVGNADPGALEAQVLMGENQAQETSPVTSSSFYEGAAGQQEVVNAEQENENILKQLGAQQQTQQLASEDVRSDEPGRNVYGGRFAAANRNRK